MDDYQIFKEKMQSIINFFMIYSSLLIASISVFLLFQMIFSDFVLIIIDLLYHLFLFLISQKISFSL